MDPDTTCRHRLAGNKNKSGPRNAKVPARSRSLGWTVSVFVRDFVEAGAGLAFLLGGVQESLRTGVSVIRPPLVCLAWPSCRSIRWAEWLFSASLDDPASFSYIIAPIFLFFLSFCCFPFLIDTGGSSLVLFLEDSVSPASCCSIHSNDPRCFRD